MTIIHVSEADVTEETGMGRVAWHWKRAFQRRGHDFVEIGPSQIGTVPHKALLPRRAYGIYRKQRAKADLFLVHEPLSGAFVSRGVKTVAFSHGLERRKWQLTTAGAFGSEINVRWRTRLFFPLWRIRPCDAGIRRADLSLLINSEDASFAKTYYGLGSDRFRIFQNGVYPSRNPPTNRRTGQCFILFLGTWCGRKGIKTLADAARILFQRGVEVQWILAGTGVDSEQIFQRWPQELRNSTEVIKSFKRTEEEDLYQRCDIFVLPSLYEGQPLAMLQAMETGRCCVASNCCGQKDIIKNLQNGLLHAPGEPADLAAQLEQAARSEPLRDRLGRAAHAAVAGRHWDKVSAEVVSLVEGL
jgi:glycosyltransferase involved in cell wall biosynthesis